jgi:hypothetical protein
MAIIQVISERSADEFLWAGCERRYLSSDGKDGIIQRTYIGLVLEKGERNMYDDSDMYALVWDESAQEPRKVFYASTMYPSYDNSAQVDATPEVVAKYTAYKEKAVKEEKARAFMGEIYRVRKGRAVKVIKGRRYDR